MRTSLVQCLTHKSEGGGVWSSNNGLRELRLGGVGCHRLDRFQGCGPSGAGTPAVLCLSWQQTLESRHPCAFPMGKRDYHWRTRFSSLITPSCTKKEGGSSFIQNRERQFKSQQHKWVKVNQGKLLHMTCMQTSHHTDTHNYTPSVSVMGAGVGCNEFVYKLL